MKELLDEVSSAITELRKKSRGEQFDQKPLSLVGIYLTGLSNTDEADSRRILAHLQDAMNLGDSHDRIRVESHRLLSDSETVDDIEGTSATIEFCETLFEAISTAAD